MRRMVAGQLLSPEARLLLLTAGSAANDGEIAELLAAGIDWQRLTMLATSERAESVAARRLRSVLRGPLPPEAGPLERLARVADFRQARIEERLRASLAALAEVGIEVLLLKGAALAVSQYRSFLERPMADLDLLVVPDRADEAYRELLASGWAPAHDPQLESFYRSHHHLAPLQDARGTGIGLDLHRAPLCPGSPFDFSGALMRERAIAVQVGDARAFVPESHDQFLHLCMHFGWSHLLASGAWRTFRDLGTLIDAGGIDWETFIDRARAHRAATCCYWVLRLGSRLAKLAVPEQTLRSLQPTLPAAVLATLERHYLLQILPAASVTASVRLTAFLWAVGMQPERMGHGSARPWDRTAAYYTSRTGRPTGARPGLATRLRGLSRWGVYTRAMIGAR